VCHFYNYIFNVFTKLFTIIRLQVRISYKYFGGVDLMQIEGVSNATLLSIISEIGPDGFQKSDTSKHFASWLRLAPNNKKTGGKIISNKVPKGSNRLKIALRNAANAFGNLKDPTCQTSLEKYCTGKDEQLL
jgi:transposase